MFLTSIKQPLLSLGSFFDIIFLVYLCTFTRRLGVPMEKILIAEDESKIRRIIELQLKHIGYETVAVTNGKEALDALETASYDLVLMDIMMPIMDGITACKVIKTQYPNTKVIMLTAKDDINDVIVGLDSGADDYVTKPFIFEELLARIRANIRKTATVVNTDNIISFLDLEINTTTFEVFRETLPITLSKTEFDLLYYMVLNKEIVLTREQILNHVWGYDYFGGLNIVDVYIKYLRDKVDRPFERKIIQTVRGRGYVVK